MPTIKIPEETLQRINKVFRNLMEQKILVTNSTVLEMVEKASWNFKIKAILEKLEKAGEEG